MSYSSSQYYTRQGRTSGARARARTRGRERRGRGDW